MASPELHMGNPHAFFDRANYQKPAACNDAPKPSANTPVGCPFAGNFKMAAVDNNYQVPSTYRQVTPNTTDIKSATYTTEVEIIDVDVTSTLNKVESIILEAPAPSLGVLEHFKGTFVGTGFNTIFRPKNPSSKPDMVKPTGIPANRDDNILELNLITERLEFQDPLGAVPNRGLFGQADIDLNGVPYIQRINDVTNPETGMADKKGTGIHFEPGLWMHVPATTIPKQQASLSRMGSIPHGTVINAQGLDPNVNSDTFVGFNVPDGQPRFEKLDTSPFPIGQPTTKIHFPSMDAEDDDTPRIPQDLSKFIKSGLITSDIIKNPNLVLENANVGKRIVETIVFDVSTSQRTVGDGISNIDFLEGQKSEDHQANADASHMKSIFWIEKVKHQIKLQPWKVGDPDLILTPIDTAPGGLAPRFRIHPDRPITTARVIDVTATHIQYSQTVLLDFFGLSWPHVSVATLIPDTSDDKDAILVPNSALL